MTSQVARIKDHFKAFGFNASDIRAKVIKNKYGENIDTSIRLNAIGGRDLRDKVVRNSYQIAKAGYNLDIEFFNGKVLFVSIREAKYGKRGVVDFGQRRISIEKWIKVNRQEEIG